ncbi:AfsR/SARP family transcriptional regulator [Nocardioides sp. P5_C9_2]
MLEIKLFGTTRVAVDGAPVPSVDLGGAKPRQILEILALSAGVPVPKDRLAELLWAGHPPPSYLGTLESYVCVLRRSLGLGRGRGSVLSTVMRGYVLDPAGVSVDLLDFRRLVRRAGPEADPRAALAGIEEALALVGGPLLAGVPYEGWAGAERETFRRELVGATTLAASHAISLGEHDLAVRMARQATTADGLAEDAWCLLMRALWSLGRPTEALRAFLTLRSRLASELGTDPCASSQDLYLQILRADGGDPSGAGQDAREEVRILLGLLRRAVSSVPGLEEAYSDQALVRVASDLVA